MNHFPIADRCLSTVLVLVQPLISCRAAAEESKHGIHESKNKDEACEEPIDVGLSCQNYQQTQIIFQEDKM